jgi:hypothetical protein
MSSRYAHYPYSFTFGRLPVFTAAVVLPDEVPTGEVARRRFPPLTPWFAVPIGLDVQCLTLYNVPCLKSMQEFLQCKHFADGFHVKLLSRAGKPEVFLRSATVEIYHAVFEFIASHEVLLLMDGTYSCSPKSHAAESLEIRARAERITNPKNKLSKRNNGLLVCELSRSSR